MLHIRYIYFTYYQKVFTFIYYTIERREGEQKVNGKGSVRFANSKILKIEFLEFYMLGDALL
jgi:hypothetical protein